MIPKQLFGYLLHLRKVNVIQTITLNWNYLFARNNLPKIIAYRKSTIEATSSAKIRVQNVAKLTLNKSWTGRSPFPYYLTLGNNALLEVLGRFDLYEGGHIGLSDDAQLTLGSGYANSNLRISCRKRITIGHNVLIGPNVTIRDSDDHLIRPVRCSQTKEVTISDNVWIGTNATILKGVTIGNGSVIAAGSVVTKDIPAHTLAGGVPAKTIKTNITWE